MAYKDAFLNSLSDEQLGIFCAYEYNDNLDDILQDYITPVQYSLFMEWKNNEAVAPIENAAATNNADSAKLDNLLSVVNNITTMLVGLNERMDSIELKITTLDLNQKDQTEQLYLEISNLKQRQVEDQQEYVRKDTLLSLERNKVKEDLQTMLKEMKDSSVTKEIKEETYNKDIIKTILKDMKRYKEDEEIEKNSTEIIRILSSVSDKARMNIIESGILEYMKGPFLIYWPSRNKREDMLENIFIVFFIISLYSTDKYLIKDSFFELFMLPFVDTNFSKFNIIAGNLLSHLLFVQDEDWTVRMTKEQVDILLVENIPKWQLGLVNPFYSTSFEWPLQQINNGRKSHKLFYSWLMANQLTAEPAKYTELWKKEEQSLNKLEELVSWESTDDEDAFLNSLSDEQLGIFYAYEYNDNLDDILQDYITPIQYSLFMKWKNNEAVTPIENAAATNNAESAKLDNLLSVVNNITTMLVGLNERMDCIESNQQEVIGKIATLELNQKNPTEQDISSLKQHLEEVIKSMSTLELNKKKETDKLSLNLKQHIAETTEGVLKNQQDLIGKIAILELNQKNQLSLDFSSLKQQLDENQQEDVMKAALRPKDYKAEVKDYLTTMLLRLEDSTVTKEMKEEIYNEDMITKILKDMKRFKEEEEIEKNSVEIMWQLSGVSDKARMNIIESGILEYMNELFVIYWPSRNKREAMLTNIYYVFYNISWHSSTNKHLIKDTFFELFKLPFADPNFSKFNVIPGHVFVNLLLVKDIGWTVKMTKEQVDNLLIENIPKWQLGLFNPFVSTSFEWTLQQISNARKSQKIFESWDMANHLTADPAKYTEILKKEEQSVKRLEELVANKSTDAEDAFLNSLSDEQLGIFYAYEYNDNLDDILQDYITNVQYSLFMEWKNNEAVAPIENAAATNNADSAKLDNLLSVVNIITTMLVGLNERMDSIESSVAVITKNQQEVIGKIATLELNQKNQTDKLYLNVKQHIAETTEGVVKIMQDTLLSLERNKVNEDLQTMLKEMKDSSVTDEIKEEICNKDIIKKILKDMKRFKEDEEIEKNSSQIMWKLSCVSDKARMNIIESGILEYLKELFISYWPIRKEREDILTNTYYAFFHISCYYSTNKHLLKDSFFELFMLPFGDPNFSKFNIIAGNLLANLLFLQDKDWTVTMTKEQVDNLLIEVVFQNTPKWQLGLFNPFPGINLEWRLQQISNGRKSQKIFHSWLMANQLTADAATYTELWKKEEQTVEKIEELVANKSTDDVKKYLKICLEIIRK